MRGLEPMYLDLRGGIAGMVAKIVPQDDVDDIVQETYLRICRVAMVDEIQNPRAYIYRVARNLALDSLKRSDNSQTVPLIEELALHGPRTDDVSVQAESQQMYARFQESVQRLPAQARRVFVMKKVYGYTQKQISDNLGISQSTVEKHVALAVRRCSRYMLRNDALSPQLG